MYIFKKLYYFVFYDCVYEKLEIFCILLLFFKRANTYFISKIKNSLKEKLLIFVTSLSFQFDLLNFSLKSISCILKI